MNIEEEKMNLKFRPIFRELKSLRRKINKKEGIIFTSHIYSIDELLNSTHHQKIDSFSQKIGDDVKNWYNKNKLTKMEEEVYYFKRKEIEQELDEINEEIEEREPTWWEKIKEPSIAFVKRIMNNLPEELRTKILPYLSNIFKDLGKNTLKLISK